MSDLNYTEQLSIDDIHTVLCRDYGSHDRLPALLDLADDIEGKDWLVLLGQLWSTFDNIGIWKGDLFNSVSERVWDIESLIPEMMEHDERMAFDALPEQITIYRGCGPKNIPGFSWSLDRKIAERFPFMGRYWADEPKLLTATINKSRAAALKLGRNEQEVIVFDYHYEPSVRWVEEPIHTPPQG